MNLLKIQRLYDLRLKKQQRPDFKLPEGLAPFSIMEAQVRVPLKSPAHHITIVLLGLKGALNFNPIMPRDASLSDSKCRFFQSGYDLQGDSE